MILELWHSKQHICLRSGVFYAQRPHNEKGGFMAYDIYNIHMGKARCALDLGDGSERASYVNQDYILDVLKRPHRCVNLMYTYYPLDKEWPNRISEACADMDVKFAWDYPYDDYFPYGENNEPFGQMKDIRRHGQDVMLTLTIDIKTPKEDLIRIARELKPFGRMRLRINHECNGNWFTHNKRYTYKEVGDFFAEFAEIIKKEAPNIKTIFCAGLKEADEAFVPYEEEFASAYRACDVYSCDKYLALHWGWPYDIAEIGSDSFEAQDLEHIYKVFNETAAHLDELFGDKEFILGEFNADGDVTGPYLQAEAVRRFYDRIEADDNCLINAVSMYQFRDKGRLGLEIENPSNPAVGIRQPLLDTYREIMERECFKPQIARTDDEKVIFPADLRWGGSEDADGIEIMVHFDKTPVFFEVVYDENISLMTECGGRWFYKAEGVSRVDMMSLFFDGQNGGPGIAIPDGGADIPLRIFTTPKDGVNSCRNDDECVNYYDTLMNEPEFRIRYEPCGAVK